MCGIAGILNLNENLNLDSSWLEKMGQSMFHRGPDDGGIEQPAPQVALVSQRLAIMDLSPCGHMPMSTSNGRLWIAYNGEVYNFPEIREDLIAKGYKFNSSGDTEVILKAYDAWGQDCLERLNGMFAFAIWNQDTQELFLARDRVGIKPLYYYHDKQRVVFASELHTITQSGIPELNLTISQKNIDQFFTLGYFPAPSTIIDNVSKLEPGHCLTITKGKLHKHRYWHVNFHPTEVRSETELLDEFDELISSSVKHRMLADVPVGSFLSGGVDSSIVTALAAKHSSQPIKTFSIGYRSTGYDESKQASIVANYLGTSHERLIIDEHNLTDQIIKTMQSYDEPLYDPSAVPTSIVSELARKHVTVALSGDGGDELFFGYHNLLKDSQMHESRKLWSNLSGPLAKLIKWGTKIPPLEALDFGFRAARKLGQSINLENRNTLMLAAAGRLWHERYSDWPDYFVSERSRMPAGARIALSGTTNHDKTTKDLLRTYYSGQSSNSSISKLSGIELYLYMSNDILTKVDRMSMQHSLECRVPLLDHRVIEFAARVPEELKYKNGSQKWFLKKYLERVFPDPSIRKVITRRKHGFSFPYWEYLQTSLKDQVHDCTMNTKFAHAMGFDVSEIQATLEDAYAGRNGVTLTSAWMLFCLYLWWEKHNP